MTLVEFLDANAIHNILSTLLLSPARVILFGEDAEALTLCMHRLGKLLTARKLHAQIEILHVPSKNYDVLFSQLETLVMRYPDCVFDLTGGDTEVLVAMGAISQKHGIPMHLTDPASSTLRPFSSAFPYPPLLPAALSIREHASLYGGKMTEALLPPPSEAFWKDVLAVWSVSRQDTARWNLAISALHVFCPPEEMGGTIRYADLKARLSPKKEAALIDILRALAANGCLSHFRADPSRLFFRLKSEAVQTAMKKEGAVLELYTYYAACVFSSANCPYTDGACGVMLDWSAAPPSFWKDDVRNEIDVFLMQGVTPILISCKNGLVDADELYKLSVVADRFGGNYCRCAVVLTKHRPDPSFLARAKELGIQIIPAAHTLSPAVLFDKISALSAK